MPFSDAGSVLIELSGRIAFAGRYFCDLVGVEHDKIPGMSCFDFVFPEDMDAAKKLFEATSSPRSAIPVSTSSQR